MKKGDVRRLRGSHRLVTIVSEGEKEVQIRTFSGIYRLVKREDLLMPISYGCKWMRPFVDGDAMYTFFKWFFSEKNERRIFKFTIILIVSYITFNIFLSVFNLR